MFKERESKDIPGPKGEGKGQEKWTQNSHKDKPTESVPCSRTINQAIILSKGGGAICNKGYFYKGIKALIGQILYQ